MRKIWAIGDIHGQEVALNNLLLEIDAGEEDLLVFLGDYIDRGPDSRGVVRKVLDQISFRHIALWGNHEAMAAQAYGFTAPGRPRDPVEVEQYWPKHPGNGGQQTIGSFDGKGWPTGHGEQRLASCPEMLVHLFRRLENFWVEDHGTHKYEFVHAYARPGISLEALFDLPSPGSVLPSGADCALWQKPLPTDNDENRLVIVGHVASKSDNLPYRRGHHLCIDTGAGYGGPVTALGFFPELGYDQQFVAIQCGQDGFLRHLISRDTGHTWDVVIPRGGSHGPG